MPIVSFLSIPCEIIVHVQYRSSPILLLILTPRRHRDVPIQVNGHVQDDRPATDLAIFDVALLGQRIVHQNGYRFAAIGAADVGLRDFGHLWDCTPKGFVAAMGRSYSAVFARFIATLAVKFFFFRSGG